MVSGNAENKSAFENSIFLKVDSVEPVYKSSFTPGYSCIDGIKVWIGGDGHIFECEQFAVCDPKAAVEEGREQMRQALIDIFTEMGQQSRKNIFGSCYFEAVVRDHTPEEIITGWEKWKKEKEEVHVRDEVVHKNTSTVKFAVTEIHDAYMSGVAKDGNVYRDCTITEYKKTGLHVDDLDAYLGYEVTG